MITKKKALLLLVLSALLVGVLFGIQAMDRGKIDEKTPSVQPAAETGEEAPAGGKPTEGTTPEVKPAQKEPRARPEKGVMEIKVTPAGTGEVFGDGDLELVRARSADRIKDPEREKPDITDSLDPRLKEALEKAEGLVDDFDEKTLEVTAEVLEEIPFLNLKPEKAELRPGGGGVELSIELSPEALGIGEKQHGNPPEGASPDEAETSPSEGPDSEDEAAEKTS
jgi:hypothetical protein